MLISCFLEGLEPYGTFIGCFLEQFGQRDNLLQYKNSIDFFNKVSTELEKFLDVNEYSQPNIEKWFSRLLFMLLIHVMLLVLVASINLNL